MESGTWDNESSLIVNLRYSVESFILTIATLEDVFDLDVYLGGGGNEGDEIGHIARFSFEPNDPLPQFEAYLGEPIYMDASSRPGGPKDLILETMDGETEISMPALGAVDVRLRRYLSDGSSEIVASGQVFSFPASDVLLGDVNRDGVINLLDVSPFVDVLSNGEYQLEADCNEDGAVNLLDVGPFITILSGE